MLDMLNMVLSSPTSTSSALSWYTHSLCRLRMSAAVHADGCTTGLPTLEEGGM